MGRFERDDHQRFASDEMDFNRQYKARRGLGAVALNRIAANPTFTAGAAVVLALSGWIVTNAMLLQPGKHPAPLFDASPSPLIAIASHAAPPPQPALAGQNGAGQNSAGTNAALVKMIEAGLAAEGFYHGPMDGIETPAAIAAISAFQKARGLAVDGEPSDAVLFALGNSPQGSSGQVAAAGSSDKLAQPGRPRARPAPTEDAISSLLAGQNADIAAKPVPSAADAAVVARELPAASRDDANDLSPVPPQPIPAAPQPAPVSTSLASVGAKSLAGWQRGLQNMGFGPTNTDGVMTQETHDAVRRFERYFQLPQDGEFNDQVIDKMKSSGYLD